MCIRDRRGSSYHNLECQRAEPRRAKEHKDDYGEPDRKVVYHANSDSQNSRDAGRRGARRAVTVAARARRRTMTGALVLTLGLAVTGTFLLHGYLPALDWVQSWLLAVTGFTFLTYGYDKLVAGTGATRVPERALLTLVFAGGTVGALLGMRLFHPKTSKESFLERFWLVVAVQVVAVAGWYLFLRPH